MEPPGPFSSAYYTYDGDDSMAMSVKNGRKPFLINFKGKTQHPRSEAEGNNTGIFVQMIVIDTEKRGFYVNKDLKQARDWELNKYLNSPESMQFIVSVNRRNKLNGVSSGNTVWSKLVDKGGRFYNVHLIILKVYTCNVELEDYSVIYWEFLQIKQPMFLISVKKVGG